MTTSKKKTAKKWFKIALSAVCAVFLIAVTLITPIAGATFVSGDGVQNEEFDYYTPIRYTGMYALARDNESIINTNYGEYDYQEEQQITIGNMAYSYIGNATKGQDVVITDGAYTIINNETNVQRGNSTSAGSQLQFQQKYSFIHLGQFEEEPVPNEKKSTTALAFAILADYAIVDRTRGDLSYDRYSMNIRPVEWLTQDNTVSPSISVGSPSNTITVTTTYDIISPVQQTNPDGVTTVHFNKIGERIYQQSHTWQYGNTSAWRYNPFANYENAGTPVDPLTFVTNIKILIEFGDSSTNHKNNLVRWDMAIYSPAQPRSGEVISYTEGLAGIVVPNIATVEPTSSDKVTILEFDWIEWLTTLAEGFLSTPLIGEFTIGMLLWFIIGLGVIFFLLKLFLGG